MIELWAKKQGDPEIQHPLVYHLIDTAMVVQRLWKKSFHDGLRKTIAKQLNCSEIEAESWLAFLAGLHDIGKASPDFQRKSEVALNELQKKGFLFSNGSDKTKHGNITAKILPELLQKKYFTNKKVAKYLGLSLGGHHGVFPESKEVRQLTPTMTGGKEWQAAQENLFVKLAQLLLIDFLSKPNWQPPNDFYIFLAGLTSVADWIASCEDFFPFSAEEINIENYFQSSQKMAEEAIDNLRWSDWLPPEASIPFKDLFPLIAEPRPLQILSEKIAKETPSPGLVIMEVPMGEGKTEAAMSLSDAWAARLKQQGCYFALPSQATSNQMFKRVKEFLSRRYEQDKVNLLLLHGKASLSKDFNKIKINSLWDEQSNDSAIVAESWFCARKRGLLAPFGVGTIDQLLLAVLQTKHVFVRLFGLANKTVIIDEVHAYDTYMSTLLEGALKWLAAMNTKVIILSATLPQSKRKTLISAYVGNDNFKAETAYPRISWTEGKEIYSEHVEVAISKTLHIKHVEDSNEYLADFLQKATANGGYIAVVCNTVKRAQDTYSALKDFGFNDEECYLFHARFPFQERDDMEQKVLDVFGKEHKRSLGKHIILVATQVIEQSLDLDFDLMISDIAPIDLLLQRSGRIHRHNHQRPAGLEYPALCIRMPELGNDGCPDFGSSAYVYEEYILLKSYLAIQQERNIYIPGEVEDLIESVYGDAMPETPPQAFAQKIIAAKKKSESSRLEDTFKARLNIIPEPDTSARLTEFLSGFNSHLEEDNPETHASLQAKTRLGPPSVKVICLHEVDGICSIDREGKIPLDLDKIPDAKTTNLLIMREISISHRVIVNRFLDQNPPDAWRKKAILRHHRVLIFQDNVATIDRYKLTLDQKLGLLIEKPGGDNE